MAFLGEELLCAALRIEVKSRDYYAGLAEQIVNRRARRKIQALSRNEEIHRKLIERRYYEVVGTKCSDAETAGSDMVNPQYLAQHVFTDQTSAADAVSFAIGLENEALRFYSEHLESADDLRDIKMLKRLIQFEQKHKDKLQAEYARLTRSFHWVPEM